MILGQVFNPKTICVNLESVEKEEVFEELVEKLIAYKPNLNRQNILNAIMERENLMSTGIKEGIAVPHGKTNEVEEVIGVLGISKNGKLKFIDIYEIKNTKPDKISKNKYLSLIF